MTTTTAPQTRARAATTRPYTWVTLSPASAGYSNDDGTTWVLYVDEDYTNRGRWRARIGKHHPDFHRFPYGLGGILAESCASRENAQQVALCWLDRHPVPRTDTPTPAAEPAFSLPGYAWYEKQDGKVSVYSADGGDRWLLWVDSYNHGGHYNVYVGINHPLFHGGPPLARGLSTREDAQQAALVWLQEHPPTAPEPREEPTPEPAFSLPGYTWEKAAFPDTELYSAEGGERWLLWACTREDGTCAVHVGIHHPLYTFGISPIISENLPTLDAAKAAGLIWLKEHPPLTPKVAETETEPAPKQHSFEARITVEVCPSPTAPTDNVYHIVSATLVHAVDGKENGRGAFQETVRPPAQQAMGPALAEAGRRQLADALCMYLLALPAGARAKITTNVKRTRDANAAARAMVASLGLRVTWDLTGDQDLGDPSFS